MSKDNFVTKEHFDKSLKASEKRTKEIVQASEKRVIKAMKTMMEIRDEELQGAHEDELDVIAGEKVTPTSWKSIPRRLKAVEDEVEKIKDRIA